MRWATQGTLVAAQTALSSGLAINLGGGFHHAKPDRGEGFNAYNDVAIAIASLRSDGTLTSDDAILYVDCDTHQGNGVCHCLLEDSRVKIFDIFNEDIYPFDPIARNRIDYPCPLRIRTSGDDYLLELQRTLPAFVDRVVAQNPVRLAFYNAGTDPYIDDPLGALNLSAEHILERDVWVVSQLRARNIPVVMVLGGGYTKQGYQLVANSVLALLQRFA